MLNPLDLSGRTILVTGASSGIGRETSILLSELGARLILVARRENELLKTQALLKGDGHVVEPYNISDFDDISSWLKTLVQKNGVLSGLVHSAGRACTVPLRFTTNAQVNELFTINVNLAIALAKAFRQKGVYGLPSSMVFLGSVMGLVGKSGISAYSASKGAIIALTKALAMELAGEKIRVNCVAPALVQTEMVESAHSMLTPEQQNDMLAMSPLGIGTTRDVANAIAFLIADTARWITGTTLVVDGGYTAQ